jgi:serine/threonine-protein kinase RsbW
MSINVDKPQAVSHPATLQLELGCDLPEVRRAAFQLRRFLKGLSFRERDLWDCELAFVDGCNNAVQHSAAPERQIQVNVTFENGQIELKISDTSEGFAWPESIKLPQPDAESGRGIYLIKSLMDQVSYVRDKSSNCLVLKKNVTGI